MERSSPSQIGRVQWRCQLLTDEAFDAFEIAPLGQMKDGSIVVDDSGRLQRDLWTGRGHIHVREPGHTPYIPARKDVSEMGNANVDPLTHTGVARLPGGCKPRVGPEQCTDEALQHLRRSAMSRPVASAVALAGAGRGRGLPDDIHLQRIRSCWRRRRGNCRDGMVTRPLPSLGDLNQSPNAVDAVSQVFHVLHLLIQQQQGFLLEDFHARDTKLDAPRDRSKGRTKSANSLCQNLHTFSGLGKARMLVRNNTNLINDLQVCNLNSIIELEPRRGQGRLQLADPPPLSDCPPPRQHYSVTKVDRGRGAGCCSFFSLWLAGTTSVTGSVASWRISRKTACLPRAFLPRPPPRARNQELPSERIQVLQDPLGVEESVDESPGLKWILGVQGLLLYYGVHILEPNGQIRDFVDQGLEFCRGRPQRSCYL
ncbi:hypothetical protein CONLIGDRAFT_233687 [Coniochaeta ligniaria NRRL 30616]|uniref:Uncharacterized protein n=1 Tax=Coniochaeta ligniaria NRRL 30616 TaxID=1408157 RepID=A0A1J7IWG6_9PEZI|nr:hypothetical protein CONLIGDRAFT_233687 [Coniochaeta ligniaria NRRL 30616]